MKTETNTSAIEECIKNIDDPVGSVMHKVREEAEKQLAALKANQIKGRCLHCVNDKCPCIEVSDMFYCADFKGEKQ